MTDHDQFLKKLFMTFFSDLLKIAVPELAPRLRPEEATFLMQETFSAVVEKGYRAIADLVAETPILDDLLSLVLVHTEVEGQHRTVMSERMLFYYMHLRLNYRRLVIPIVVNLKGGPPGITRQTVVDQVGGEVINTFHYYVLGLEQSPAEEFLEREEPLAWGLAAMARPRSGDRAEQRFRCLQKVARGRLDELREQLLVNLVETYLPLAGDEKQRYDEMVASEESEEVKAMEMTWAGKLKAEGRAEGRAEGQAEGARHMLLRLMERRFGPLPEAVRQRLQALQELEELDRLSDRLLTARSLEELGLTA